MTEPAYHSSYRGTVDGDCVVLTGYLLDGDLRPECQVTDSDWLADCSTVADCCPPGDPATAPTPHPKCE